MVSRGFRRRVGVPERIDRDLHILSRVLLVLRRELGLYNFEVAEILGVSPATVSGWARGRLPLKVGDSVVEGNLRRLEDWLLVELRGLCHEYGVSGGQRVVLRGYLVELEDWLEFSRCEQWREFGDLCVVSRMLLMVRRVRGLTGLEVAEEIGVSLRTIRRWESGEFSIRTGGSVVGGGLVLLLSWLIEMGACDADSSI